MNKTPKIGIIGGGITGLAAGIATGAPVFEADTQPGGLSSSFYIDWPSCTKLGKCPTNKEAFRFETGGGHWIFGTDKKTYDFLSQFGPMRSYNKNAAVYFPDKADFIPYPIQENIKKISIELRNRRI